MMDGVKQMACYGKRDLDPHQMDGSWKTTVKATDLIATEHLANVGDNSGYFRGIEKLATKEAQKQYGSYYGQRTRQTEAEVLPVYERLFHQRTGYNSKMHRDDRKNIITVGIAMNEEEAKRPFPVLTSSEYGRRLHSPLELFQRTRTRIDHIVKGFYYRQGTGIPPKRGPGVPPVSD